MPPDEENDGRKIPIYNFSVEFKILDDKPRKIRRVNHKHSNAARALELFVLREYDTQEKHNSCGYRHNIVESKASQEVGIVSYRRNQCRRAEYKQNIEYIAAHDIAYRDVALALARCGYGSYEFGKRSAECHYRKSYEAFAHTDFSGNSPCTVDRHLRAEHYD